MGDEDEGRASKWSRRGVWIATVERRGVEVVASSVEVVASSAEVVASSVEVVASSVEVVASSVEVVDSSKPSPDSLISFQPAVGLLGEVEVDRGRSAASPSFCVNFITATVEFP